MTDQELIVVIGDAATAKDAVQAVRKHKVYAEILSPQDTAASLAVRGLRGVILVGTPSESHDSAIMANNIPVLEVDKLSLPEAADRLAGFLFDQCGCSGSWHMTAYAQQAVAAIRRTVGSGRAICGLSGGVDSSVAATLVQKAIGDRLTTIFVDHGLLRQGEAEEVVSTFRGRGFNLVHVDAKERFLKRLAGVNDPEQKRKIIGHEFIRVFEEEAERLGQVDYLVQGTVYPDVIESGSGSGVKIKSHHNVGGLPEDMALGLIEPLRYLFKDEVRDLGQVLGLPEDLIWRHPFPGPGLAVRIIGEITPDKVAVLQAADAIFIEEIKAAGLYRQIWQAFAALPDAKSVGMTAGDRSYGYVIALRAVTSIDAMTADWFRLPYEVLDKVMRRITAEVPAINRVVYDITSKPPGTIEWE